MAADSLKTGLLITREGPQTHIISALQRIPPEILSHIFVLCIPSTPPKPHSCDAPVLLEAICRWWRDVAWSTPQLWTSMHLELTVQTIELDTSSAKTWLSRSAGYPLTIHLGPAIGSVSPGAHYVLDDVFVNCHRWKEVHLTLSHDLISRFRVVKGRLPLLENLFISVPTHQPTWPRLVDAFEHAPRLRSLQLEENRTRSKLELPWQALTKLVLGEGSPRTFIRMLGECPNLEHLKISSVERCLDHGGREPLQLQHLRILDIGTDTEVACIFDELVLPALREVYLSLHPDSIFDKNWDCILNFVSLLSRSQCSIQILSLKCEEHLCLSDIDIITCLRAAPSLLELIIRGYAAFSLTRDVLRRLTHRPQNGTLDTCLVPKLHTLKIDWLEGAFLDKTFARMVESRWTLRGVLGESVARLQTVEIDIMGRDEDDDPEDYDSEDDSEDEVAAENQFNPSMMRETLRVLQKYREDGMEVRVMDEDANGDRTDWSQAQEQTLKGKTTSQISHSDNGPELVMDDGGFVNIFL